MITRKDKNRIDTATSSRDLEQGERDKLELARKVKKELADEAEKVESIRKAVAVEVRLAYQVDVEQKLKEVVGSFDHKIELHEQKEESMFTATDLIMKNLMDKIVETAHIQAEAIVKINDALDYLRRLLYQMSSKVDRVEDKQDVLEEKNDK